MSNKTIISDFPLEAIECIFEDDKFYVKFFKDLLYAVTYNNFSRISKTPSEIINLYSNIRNRVENFIKEEIYENIYTSKAYDGLISALIDIYAVMYTVVYMRQNITDIAIQPDAVVDNYLDMFGFSCKELFNYIQRREICKVVYWYLRRKGTPGLIIKLLNMLGFNYFYIAEFKIYEKTEIDDNTLENTIFNNSWDKHLYKTELLYEELPEKDTIGFFSENNYDYTLVREEDPLNIKTDEQMSDDPNITYPAQSPYYQVGAIITYTHLERLIAAFTYAMINKTYIDINNGEEVFNSTVTGYNKNVSFISLILGYTYILGEYFGVHDNNLYEPYTIKEEYDNLNLKYDIGNVPSRWVPFEGNELPVNEFEEYDAGFANNNLNSILDYNNGPAKEQKTYSNIYDGGDATFEIIDAELNGGIADTIYEYIDCNNGPAKEQESYSYIYDGGDANSEFIDIELNGGIADTIYEDDNIDSPLLLDGGYCGYEWAQYNAGASYDNFDNQLDNTNATSQISNSVNGGEALLNAFNKESIYNGEYDNGFADTFDITIEDNRVDNFFLRNGYTYAKYDYGELSRREIGDLKVPNERNVYDRDVDLVLYDKYGNQYDKETALRNIEDDPENNILYKLKYPVFGWQKPVALETPIDIMVDIDNELKRLCSKLHWLPDEPEIRLVDSVNTIIRNKNNIKTRRDENLKEIFEIFYGKPIYGKYDRAIASFIDHDNDFKEYIDSILLTAEERTALMLDEKVDDLAKNFENVLELLNNILESVEYYIFDNTSYILPVRNLVLTYDKVIKMLMKLDEYYTPYHAKLLFPFIAWMIRDLPGDNVAIDDSDKICLAA